MENKTIGEYVPRTQVNNLGCKKYHLKLRYRGTSKNGKSRKIVMWRFETYISHSATDIICALSYVAPTAQWGYII